jgi:hypothetical protein
MLIEDHLSNSSKGCTVRTRIKTALFAFILAMLISGESRAEILGDTLKPFASLFQTYDGNVFRVKDSNQLKAQIGDEQLDDFITVISLGTGLHYQISEQIFNATLKRDFLLFDHYANQNVNRDLISTSLNLSAFEKLKVNLEGIYSNSPEPRADYRGVEVNERQELTGGIGIGYTMITGVGFDFTYRRTNIDFSLPQYRANQYVTDLYAGTVSYRISPDTKVYTSLQRENRDYNSLMNVGPVLINNSSTSDSIRIGLSRALGAKTGLSGYMGYLDRRHEQAASRNFDGIIGRFDITYGIAPLTTLMLTGERQLYEETYAYRLYSVSESVGVGLEYRFSNKVTASLFEKMVWKGYKDLPNTGVTGRSDRLQDLSVGIEWKPLVRVKVSAGYQFSTRESNEAINDFSAHTIQSGVTYQY